MKIPKEVKDLFNKVSVLELATSSKIGIPNISNVAGKYILNDETIIIIDNFMNKTVSNLLINPAVSILIRVGDESYQIKGNCNYFTSGSLYDEGRKWMKSISEKLPAKGVLEIKIENIYNAKGGSGAGEEILNSNIL